MPRPGPIRVCAWLALALAVFATSAAGPANVALGPGADLADGNERGRYTHD